MGELKKEYRCVLDLAHDIIGGKWKLRILWNIQQGNNRFSMLEQAIPEITQKMLMSQLRDLEDKGLIKRKIIEDNPPKIILYEIDGSNTGIREMIQATCFFQEIMRLEMVLAQKIDKNRKWIRGKFFIIFAFRQAHLRFRQKRLHTYQKVSSCPFLQIQIY